MQLPSLRTAPVLRNLFMASSVWRESERGRGLRRAAYIRVGMVGAIVKLWASFGLWVAPGLGNLNQRHVFRPATSMG